MIGASAGKSNTLAVLVQARKPVPISGSLALVSSRTMDVFPLCTLPTSHTIGADARARSAISVSVSAEVGIVRPCTQFGPRQDAAVVNASAKVRFRPNLPGTAISRAALPLHELRRLAAAGCG